MEQDRGSLSHFHLKKNIKKYRHIPFHLDCSRQGVAALMLPPVNREIPGAAWSLETRWGERLQ